ncbi:hypothetical protein A9P82_05855 [Arachidicoccus ginsenosidimutans]|nr:hypothetical protein A9P82_05855 [Arachidicoccus sp. BS20]
MPAKPAVLVFQSKYFIKSKRYSTNGLRKKAKNVCTQPLRSRPYEKGVKKMMQRSRKKRICLSVASLSVFRRANHF